MDPRAPLPADDVPHPSGEPQPPNLATFRRPGKVARTKQGHRRRPGTAAEHASNDGRLAIAPAPGTPGPEPPAAAAYLISPDEVSPGWMTLYAGTFVLQAFCASARAFVTYPALWVAFTILHLSKSPLHDLVLLLAYGPLALSLATLVLPLGGWWWQQRSGARAPSEREQMIYDEAITELTRHDPTQRPPRRWCVLDEPTTNAAVYADTLMITRGLLESAYLTPVIAHELGHLNSSDARLTASLTRLSTPPRRELRNRLMRAIAFIATGAAAVWATRLPWAAYWREREYEADAYAAKLGQAQPLAMFLDTEALEHDLPKPFPWLHDHSHPPDGAPHRPHRAPQSNRKDKQMSALATIPTRHPHHNHKPTPHTSGALIIELPRLGRATHPTTARGAIEQTTHQPPKPFARLLNAKAVAEMLNVPHTWVLAQARAGTIPHHRLGHYVRFDPDDIAQWLTEGRTEPRWRH